MIPLHRDPHFTFRFADDRVIPRFHLDGIELGRRVTVYRLDPHTGAGLDRLTEAVVGDGGWVDLAEPLLVRAEKGFVVLPSADGGPMGGVGPPSISISPPSSAGDGR